VLKRVSVTWVDSAAVGGWQKPEMVNADPMVCESVGFLVRRDAKSILLALNAAISADSSTAYGDYMVIPNCAVKKIKNLK
jgi:hypothetical protein